MEMTILSHMWMDINTNLTLQVGDGATDLAACPPADAFIGYGGNQVWNDSVSLYATKCIVK